LIANRDQLFHNSVFKKTSAQPKLSTWTQYDARWQKEKGNGVLDIDWRSAAAYEQAKVIPASGFAWEYLRRDDDYHRDFERVNRRKSSAATTLEAFSQRWGLRFPTRPDGTG
jgi:hypothetical protein